MGLRWQRVVRWCCGGGKAWSRRFEGCWFSFGMRRTAVREMYKIVACFEYSSSLLVAGLVRDFRACLHYAAAIGYRRRSGVLCCRTWPSMSEFCISSCDLNVWGHCRKIVSTGVITCNSCRLPRDIANGVAIGMPSSEAVM